MKNILSLSLLVFACSFAAVVGCSNGRATHSASLRLDGSQPKPPAQEPGRLLFESDFAAGGWAVENYENHLTMGVVQADGANAYRVENTVPGTNRVDTQFAVKSPAFAVTPGAECAVVVEARGNQTMEICNNKHGDKTSVMWYETPTKPLLMQDVLGRMVSAVHVFGFKSLSPSWLRTVRTFTVPPKAAYARVCLGADAPDIHRGEWIEVKRVAVRERERADGAWDFGDLDAPTFARLSPSPSTAARQSVRIAVNDASPLDWTTFDCLLDGTNMTAALRRDGNELVYEPTADWAPDSLHVFKLSAADAAGNVGAETLAFFRGEPLTKNLVTLRDDGMTLVDGKPFFPIAPFSVRKCPRNGNDFDRAIRDLKAAGFNTVHAYEWYGVGKSASSKARRNYRELVEACDRHGMKLIVEACDRDYKSPDRPARLREAVLDGRNHPCLLAWGIGDDTSTFRRGEEVRADHNIIKAMDNAHLTTQADGTTFPGRYQTFVHSTDTILDEIYPFRAAEPEPDGIAKVVACMNNAYDDKRAMGDPVKGIWPILQTFSGWGLWHHYPTYAEIRAQTYAAIAARARAATFYSYFSFSEGASCFAHDDLHYAEMLRFAGELASIQDDLASRDAAKQPVLTVLDGAAKDAFGGPSVVHLLKEGALGKGALLVACNVRTDASAKVKFEGLGNVERVETLFENGRSLTAEKDGVADSFAPGEVHVYRIRSK